MEDSVLFVGISVGQLTLSQLTSVRKRGQMVREGDKHEPVILTKESKEWPFSEHFPESRPSAPLKSGVKTLRPGYRQRQKPQEKLLNHKIYPFSRYISDFISCHHLLLDLWASISPASLFFHESYPPTRLGLIRWSSFRVLKVTPKSWEGIWSHWDGSDLMGTSQESIVLKLVMCLKLLLREGSSERCYKSSPLCTKKKTSEFKELASGASV